MMAYNAGEKALSVVDFVEDIIVYESYPKRLNHITLGQIIRNKRKKVMALYKDLFSLFPAPIFSYYYEEQDVLYEDDDVVLIWYDED